MASIRNYFMQPQVGALKAPLRRAALDRQYTIGRIVQALLVSGVMFGLFCGIAEELGEDPIKLLEDNAACQITSTAIEAVALGYIIWGKRGERELVLLFDVWRAEDAEKERLESLGETAAQLESGRPGPDKETQKQKTTRVEKARKDAIAAEKQRLKTLQPFGRVDDDADFGAPPRGSHQHQAPPATALDV